MQLRRDFLLSVGVLVAFNILLAFGAISLLTRMSPAIEHILRDNVTSIEAAEDLLVLLAEPARVVSAEVRRQRFELALQRAKRNVTESEEVPVLAQVEQQYRAAFAGDDRAVMVMVDALQNLIAINRQAMVMADQEAQRLGTAGAWVAVFFATVLFAVSQLVIRRLERHVLNPLIELHDVLEAVRAGNRHRRCRMMAAPEELRRVLNAVNALLDRNLNRSGRAQQRRAHARAAIERKALIHLMEQRPDALVIVDDQGEVIASNRRGLDILGSPSGAQVKQRLAQLSAVPSHDAHIEPIALPDTAGWLCALRP